MSVKLTYAQLTSVSVETIWLESKRVSDRHLYNLQFTQIGLGAMIVKFLTYFPMRLFKGDENEPGTGDRLYCR